MGKEKLIPKFLYGTVIESNDNIRISGKSINPHLLERWIKGAKQHRAWENNNKIATKIGYALGTAPLAIASYPLLSTIVSANPVVTFNTGIGAANGFIADEATGLTNKINKRYGLNIPSGLTGGLAGGLIGYGSGKSAVVKDPEWFKGLTWKTLGVE